MTETIDYTQRENESIGKTLDKFIDNFFAENFGENNPKIEAWYKNEKPWRP